MQALKNKNLNTLKTFSIPYTGLKTGKHLFEFRVEEAFFSNFEYSPIKKGSFDVRVEFNKQETMFVLEFELQGTVELLCDRCGEDFLEPLTITERLIFKPGDGDEMESNDEIVIIPRSEHEINLAPYIYEFIVVGQPLVHVHPNLENGTPGCNPVTLEILKKLSAHSEEEQKEIIIDPRWDALKKLRDN